MARYGSMDNIRKNNYVDKYDDSDEEGVLYDDQNGGYNVDPKYRKRKNKKSTFAPSDNQQSYIQHFPGGYKIETKVPAGTPVPFQAPPVAPFGSPYVAPMYGGMTPMYGGMTPYHPGMAGYGYMTPYGGVTNPYASAVTAAQSYQEFMNFIDSRDKMKEHLDKQTESLNSLKQELDNFKKDEHDMDMKVRHGRKQIIPITRSKR